jgi:hypothetical protein
MSNNEPTEERSNLPERKETFSGKYLAVLIPIVITFSIGCIYIYGFSYHAGKLNAFDISSDYFIRSTEYYLTQGYFAVRNAGMFLLLKEFGLIGMIVLSFFYMSQKLVINLIPQKFRHYYFVCVFPFFLLIIFSLFSLFIHYTSFEYAKKEFSKLKENYNNCLVIVL